MRLARSMSLVSFLTTLATAAVPNAHAASVSGPNSASASKDVALANNNSIGSTNATITAGHSNAFLVVTSGLKTLAGALGGIRYSCWVVVNGDTYETWENQSTSGGYFGNHAPLTMSRTLALDLATYGLTNQPLQVAVSCQRLLPPPAIASVSVNISFIAQIVPR